MNAPKKRQSDDEEEPHRQLGVGDAGVAGVRVVAAVVAGPGGHQRAAVAGAAAHDRGLLDRRHQASSVPGSSPQANTPKSSRIRPGMSQRISLNTAA